MPHVLVHRYLKELHSHIVFPEKNESLPHHSVLSALPGSIGLRSVPFSSVSLNTRSIPSTSPCTLPCPCASLPNPAGAVSLPLLGLHFFLDGRNFSPKASFPILSSHHYTSRLATDLFVYRSSPACISNRFFLTSLLSVLAMHQPRCTVPAFIFTSVCFWFFSPCPLDSRTTFHSLQIQTPP